VSGEIVEINEELEEDTSLINKDPYGEGWILVIAASNLDEELATLYHGESVVGFIESELEVVEAEKAKAE
jgi:glycine cleavage system H protein